VALGSCLQSTLPWLTAIQFAFRALKQSATAGAPDLWQAPSTCCGVVWWHMVWFGEVVGRGPVAPWRTQPDISALTSAVFEAVLFAAVATPVTSDEMCVRIKEPCSILPLGSLRCVSTYS
jgi:hypothetical protein